jgi:hypothetical protein
MTITTASHPGPFPLGRWIAACAAAEAIGMSASAAAARAPELLPGGGTVAVGLAFVVLGGLIEGIALGTLQSAVLRRWLPAMNRMWWILATVLVAGLGWAAASAPSQLAPPDDSAAPPLPLILIGAVALGAVMGVALGAAQAGGLRTVVRHPWAWIRISAIAWAPTMAIIFAGATTPGTDWSLPSVVLFGAATGAVAGAVLGLITGMLTPWLSGHSVTNRLVARILGSPARGLLASSLVLLRVRGRISGVEFELPVQFARTAGGIVIVPGRPERKQWWRNLVKPSAITVLIDGTWRLAVARLVVADDPEHATALADYRHRWSKITVPADTPLVLATWSDPSAP